MEVQAEQSLLEKAADAIVCQFFAFLNAREHWKFSRCSRHVHRISRLNQASPQQLDVSREMQIVEMMMQSRWNEERSGDYVTSAALENLQRLLKFRPLQLIVRFDQQIELIAMERMTQLRELTFTSGSENTCIIANGKGIEWMSQLTNLTKLKICITGFYLVTDLPSSLTQLDLTSGNVSGFLRFKDKFLLGFTNLHALQVINLPTNQYYGHEIFNAGTIFLSLRELNFGFIAAFTESSEISLQVLQACENLQSLSFCVDSGEFIFPWKSLVAMTSLRKLSVYFFCRILPSYLLNGLAEVTQLTHLKLATYRNRHISTPLLEISDPIYNLTRPISVSSADNPNDEKSTDKLPKSSDLESDNTILPRLTTLSISGELWLKDASCLSSLSTLTELELPSDSDNLINDCYFPELPHLRTLHISQIAKNKRICPLEHYKHQVSEIVLRNASLCTTNNAAIILIALRKMTKLTSLKLHPHCAFRYQNGDKSDPTALDNFRRWLPTVQVEIDNSIDN